jgi:hypothetical protein
LELWVGVAAVARAVDEWTAICGDGVATMATLGVRSGSLKRSLTLEFPLNHAP